MRCLKLILFPLLCLPFGAFASEVAGIWQHEEQPAWIEIQFAGDTATGTVRRNENKPEAVGFAIIKGLVADGDQWRGQIYADALGEYKDMKVRLIGEDEMEIKVKVGFISRTVKWRRASEVQTD